MNWYKESQKTPDDMIQIALFEGRGYSHGSHGFNGGREYAAGAPVVDDWEALFNTSKLNELNEFLQSRSATVVVYESVGGSFHEAWKDIGVYAVVKDNWDEDTEILDQLGVFYGDVKPEARSGRNPVESNRFPFKSIEDTYHSVADSAGEEGVLHQEDHSGGNLKIPASPTGYPRGNPTSKREDPYVPEPGEGSEQYWKRQVHDATKGKDKYRYKYEGD
jgi:hypothetical protein